jgi:hypothetical protein
MELKEMSLLEAAEILDIEIEETPEGLKLTHGEEDKAAYDEVTLEDAEERISESNEAYARMLEANYSSMINEMVGKLIIDNCSAWTVVASHLKTLKAKEQ